MKLKQRVKAKANILNRRFSFPAQMFSVRFVRCSCLALAVLALLLCVPSPAAAGDNGNIYVYDLTGSILSQTEGNALQDRAAEISSRHACGVYIVIVRDYTDYGRSPAAASEYIYDQYGFGLGQDNSGILLFMSMEERDYDIYSYGYGTYARNLADRDVLEKGMLQQFRNNSWYAGFDVFLNDCDQLLGYADSSYDPADYNADGFLVRRRPDMGMTLLVGVGVGLLAAFIVCAAGKAKMKSVRTAADAAGYAVPNSMQLRVKQDRFTHKTESRTRVESSSSRSGSSSGGGRPSGGGSHSSGKF